MWTYIILVVCHVGGVLMVQGDEEQEAAVIDWGVGQIGLDGVKQT